MLVLFIFSMKTVKLSCWLTTFLSQVEMAAFAATHCIGARYLMPANFEI